MPGDGPDRSFVDTNIWLYAFIETDDIARSTAARRLIQSVTAVVSTQVINEICVNLLKRTGFSEQQVRKLVDAFYERYEVVELNQFVLLAGSRLRERYSLSFWDSLIVATALHAGVPVLFSEDMQHGLQVDGKLLIQDPFAQE